MFGVSLKEVQSYMDKKFQAWNGSFEKNAHKAFATKKEIQSLQSKLDSAQVRLTKLTEYLGVEYSEVCTRGFSKVKKTVTKKQ